MVSNRVYIRQAGAVGFDGMESLNDLRNNWNRLLDVAELTASGERSDLSPLLPVMG